MIGDPVRTTKTYAKFRTVFPGGGKDAAAIVEFCKGLKLPGVVKIAMAGNGGITNIVFEGAEQECEVEPENISSSRLTPRT